jgi:hypothetical protein
MYRSMTLLATIAAAVIVLGLVTKAKAGRKRRASKERGDEQQWHGSIAVTSIVTPSAQFA